MTHEYKPGQETPYSGQYQVIGPRGGSRNKEITSTKGNPLPPTSNPGERYRLADGTKNKSGGKK